MSEGQSPQHALFTKEGHRASTKRPALLGGKCRTCGYVFFPMQTYGCESCGSQDLEPIPLIGRGKLVASAEVFMPAGPDRPAPFTVGSIVTDDGAVVRALLGVQPVVRLANGAVMVTCLAPETRPNRGTYDLRFSPAANEEA